MQILWLAILVAADILTFDTLKLVSAVILVTVNVNVWKLPNQLILFIRVL